MKRLITMLMALVMLLSLAACGGNSGNAAGSSTETPVVVAESAVEILEKVWATYGENEMFFAMGGGYENMVDNAPGSVDMADVDSLTYLAYLPESAAGLVDDAATLIHAMNANTFTGTVFHVADAANVSSVVDALKDNIMNTQWMCGFPDKLMIAVVGEDYIVSAFGNAEIMDNFQAKLTEQYGQAVTVTVEENLA